MPFGAGASEGGAEAGGGDAEPRDDTAAISTERWECMDGSMAGNISEGIEVGAPGAEATRVGPGAAATAGAAPDGTLAADVDAGLEERGRGIT